MSTEKQLSTWEKKTAGFKLTIIVFIHTIIDVIRAMPSYDDNTYSNPTMLGWLKWAAFVPALISSIKANIMYYTVAKITSRYLRNYLHEEKFHYYCKLVLAFVIVIKAIPCLPTLSYLFIISTDYAFISIGKAIFFNIIQMFKSVLYFLCLCIYKIFSGITFLVSMIS